MTLPLVHGISSIAETWAITSKGYWLRSQPVVLPCLAVLFHSTSHFETFVPGLGMILDLGASICFQVFTLGSRVTIGKLKFDSITTILTNPREVGFLRYWTLSNVPLFLLASPMLLILFTSAKWAWSWPTKPLGKNLLSINQKSLTPTQRKFVGAHTVEPLPSLRQDIVWRLLIPQILLAVLAVTTYHVQIVTRLSSGYPVWHWWLALTIIAHRRIQILRKQVPLARIIVHWMVCYALIQGGLFASFLPPA